MKWIIWLLFCVALQWQLAVSDTVLFLCGFASPSHMNVFIPLAKALADRDHDVTVLSPFPAKHKDLGIREIQLKNLQGVLPNKIVPNTTAGEMDLTEAGRLKVIYRAFHDFPHMCAAILDDEEFRKLLRSGQRYDIIVNSVFVNDCTLPIAAKLAKKGIILVAPGGLNNVMAYELNIPHPYSYVPNIALSLTYNMTFAERSVNFLTSVSFLILRNVMMLPILNHIIQERYPGYPTVQEVRKNVSIVMIKRNPVVDDAIPSVPYMQEIGGIHCRYADPLPQELEEFIEDAGDSGFIYVSFGTMIPDERFPAAAKKAFIEAFRRLPQRVIWKHKKRIPNLPSNVKTISWAPQQDILGHPNIRAFITHAGHLSLDESIYHAVPIIAMPVLGDQYVNAARVEDKGHGLQLHWADLTTEILFEKIIDVIYNSKFKESAERMSLLMRDQPETPLERAVFWVEYVMRNKGAQHLRTGAEHLNLIEYFMLDVIGALSLIILIKVYITYKIVRRIWSRIFRAR